nr:immunoglobulin heavy chain junction region [Macaca mulatta]MOY21629.1 immunoglobulin heavy chain junction region [Macaca mulatta]MOY21795.1 immunoglobulin heavy chain junction region [Macaca mulatta]MOY22522.1 immunoglobulin heavy chain junction region [Macaca mulatta]MOY22650.1 immunoglobulin heavy chain junction region [Macaca mulatta]
CATMGGSFAYGTSRLDNW